MFLIKFFHNENKLVVGTTVYKATCDVRNELNKRRQPNQVVKTFPLGTTREPYYPRKFPTGIWRVKTPIWTTEPDYAPVKIPTSAERQVVTWSTKIGKYHKRTDTIQKDSFYHLHFSRDSKTTLGCIRLNSEEDARQIAELVKFYLDKGQKVYIEVLITKE